MDIPTIRAIDPNDLLGHFLFLYVYANVQVLISAEEVKNEKIVSGSTSSNFLDALHLKPIGFATMLNTPDDFPSKNEVVFRYNITTSDGEIEEVFKSFIINGYNGIFEITIDRPIIGHDVIVLISILEVERKYASAKVMVCSRDEKFNPKNFAVVRVGRINQIFDNNTISVEQNQRERNFESGGWEDF